MRSLKRFLFGVGATILASGAIAQANKPVIAVGEITTAIGNFSTLSIQLALENALQKTNKFTIMERTRLNTLLAERGLSASGITNGISDYSGFSGVDYLVYGSVSNITVENKSILIAANCEASLSMNIRVVDVATGEIRMSESVNVNDTINSVFDPEQNACAGISLSSINILGEDVSDGIANKMTMGIFPIKVARVNGTQVYLNYGQSSINKNQILTLKSIGEGFVDPDSGEVLGAEEETTAVIIATDVRDNYSIGEIVANRSMPEVGDIAYILDSRNDLRSVQSCVKATEKAVKSCDKNPDSKSCGRDSERKAKSCSAVLDL